LSPEIYRQPTMRVVGLRTRFYSVDSDKNNIADKLPGLWASFLPRLGEIENRVGRLCYGNVKSGKFIYCASRASTSADIARR
jgi:hypothetical protein